MAFPRCTRKSSFFSVESFAVLPSAVSVTAHSGREVSYPAAAARSSLATTAGAKLGMGLLGGRGGGEELLGEVLLLLEELGREGEIRLGHFLGGRELGGERRRERRDNRSRRRRDRRSEGGHGLEEGFLALG